MHLSVVALVYHQVTKSSSHHITKTLKIGGIVNSLKYFRKEILPTCSSVKCRYFKHPQSGLVQKPHYYSSIQPWKHKYEGNKENMKVVKEKTIIKKAPIGYEDKRIWVECAFLNWNIMVNVS